MRLWALVTSALRMMKVSPCVGGCHVRVLLPPRPFRAWEGWGEWGPPIRALRNCGETSRPPEVSIIRLPLSGPLAPGGRLVLSQGPRHLGTAPAPAGEHPEVPHQCPRMGLGVDEDGPPLS